MWRPLLVRLTVLLILVGLISGCGIGRLFSRKPKDRPPEELAREAIEELKDRNYIAAEDLFTRIKDRYPYSDQALLAQVKLADALYYNEKFDEAQLAYREFEKLHPTNKAIPYVIYQQALCYYRQRPTIDRDQSYTQKALAEFRRLQKKFPDSEYATKAEKYKLRCLEDLAEHEFYVGEFYFRTKHYASALDRFQALSQQYPFHKPTEVKAYIQKSKVNLANPGGNQGFFSRLFDARW